MGDLVAYAPQLQLALAQQKTPEVLEAEQQQRIKEAEVLEEKLKVIQEEIRKAEQERWKRIEASHAAQQEKEVFEAKRRQREQEADERTSKNRAKRQKKKAKQQAKKTTKSPGAGQASGSCDDEDHHESEQGAAKVDVPQADLD